MDTPQISRSGRVLKKSAKVKEMEDVDINEIDSQGKARKKLKGMDDFDEFDDKRVAPIKIPKMSFNMPGGGPKKKINEMPSSVGKSIFKPSFQSLAKQDLRQSIYDSSDESKESDSSSSSESSSSSSTSSSEVSDDDDVRPYNADYKSQRKISPNSIAPSLSGHHDKIAVEHHRQQYESPMYMEPSSDVSSDDSEDVSSDTALVIAEDSDKSSNYLSKNQQPTHKKGIIKKKQIYAPRQGSVVRKKPLVKASNNATAKKKKPAAKAKPLSAYMLWCSENRKKIAASSGNIGFGNIGKKMGESWQALPEKEKMAWRRKAKRIALKSTGNVISTGINAQNKSPAKTAAAISEEILKGITESTVLGIAPIDAASHLKLLGDSLTVIGQRLIEHEGQLAVSGIYSVLLDTLLCAIGPLLCLTREINGLEHLSQDVFKRTLDHIAYFMPGL